MRLPSGYELQNVWREKTDRVREEIVDFWIAKGALRSREMALKRVDQVVLLVRYQGTIAAVSTAFRKRHERVGHDFYNFRCFVEKGHRQSVLGMALLLSVRDYLNARFVSGEDTSAVGLQVEIENEKIKRLRNQGLWPKSGLMYMGKNERGDHVRICYFDGARIG